MDLSARVAFVMSQVVCAQAEIEGMKAANSQFPDDQPFQADDFRAVPGKYGLDHNAVLVYLQQG